MTKEELFLIIDQYFNTPKLPPVKGLEANSVLKAIAQFRDDQVTIKDYNTIAERDADIEPPIFALVLDASGDPEVSSGAALYYYKLTEWQRIAEYDTLSFAAEWESLIGKPTSSPSQIDDAVTKRKFTENFTVNFPNNNSGLPNGTELTTDDDLESAFRTFLRKASPAVYVPPAVGISASPSTRSFEVGTEIDVVIDSSFTQNDAGAVTDIAIKKDGSTVATSEPYSEEGLSIGNSDIKYKAAYTYTQGPLKNDTLGNPSPTGRIPSGTLETGEIIFGGFRNAFIGFVLADGSAAIRALPIVWSDAAQGASLNVTVPSGAQRVSIFFKDTIRDLFRVLYVEDSNKNITGNFAKRPSTINVEGANGFTAIAYKAFDYIPVEPFPSSVTYQFTL
jgi:hypothetical protein